MPTDKSQLGTRGEGIARAYLKSRGYEILDTNYRCPRGEVDIIAREGCCLVFVEVRTRRGQGFMGSPEESISRRKRERLIATAETYLQSLQSLQSLETTAPDWRIDFIGIRLDSRGVIQPVEHIENAIQLC